MKTSKAKKKPAKGESKKKVTPKKIVVAAPKPVVIPTFNKDATYKAFVTGKKVGFSHDRTKTVGASEVMACIRKVVASKHGVAPDPGFDDIGGFAERGNHMEDWIAGYMKTAVESAGGQLLFAGQSTQMTLRGEFSSAIPDGIAVGLPRDWLKDAGVEDLGEGQCIDTEFKSISPMFSKAKLPKVQHIAQCVYQIGHIRAGTEYRPEYALLIYVNADDYSDITPFVVKYNEKIFQSLVKRAAQIMGTTDFNKALPEGKMKGESECSSCPIAKRCLGFRPYVAGDDPQAPTPEQVAQIDTLAAADIEAAKVLDEAKKKKAETEAAVYQGLNAIKRNFVKGKFVVHAKKTTLQKRYNIDLLKARIEELGGKHDDCKAETKGGASLDVRMV